jgi:hypothetical protein
VSKIDLIGNDIDCNVEANAYFLSSYGSNNCSYEFFNPNSYTNIRTKTMDRAIQDLTVDFYMLTSIAFSLLGYFWLFKGIKNEPNISRKHFLSLIALYIGISFLLMISLSFDKFNDLRYLTPTFFVPYIFLGLLLNFIVKNNKQKYIFIWLAVIFTLLIYTNFSAIMRMASPLLTGDRTCSSRSITLGEIEPIAKYMQENSDGQETIYFGGDSAFRDIYPSLAYVVEKFGNTPKRVGADPKESKDNDSPTFMVSCTSGMKKTYSYERVGKLYVFRIDKEK